MPDTVKLQVLIFISQHTYKAHTACFAAETNIHYGNINRKSHKICQMATTLWMTFSDIYK